MRVLIADLGHNQLTFSSDVYPLGVANLATYAQAHFDRATPLQIEIFREPEDLKAALDAAPCDVLGLSNYAWNLELSRVFARYARRRSPDVLTLCGGPNWPLTPTEQESFLRTLPEFDLAVEGPTYEGERAFLSVLRRFADVGGSRAALLSAPVDGGVWIDRGTGAFVKGQEPPRIENLDEIPSPYLAGLLDPFFKTGYFPMLQIARGCPFSCTFCNSGVASNSKIYAHSIDNVRADLLYIAERVRPEINVCFADDNFGMYQRDEEVADYLAYLQNRFGWPKYIRTTTGKNNTERIIRVMRKVKGALPMTAAVQSMNPEVLANIKRSNIKLETYAKLQDELAAQGMQSYGELILCLPGETKASFMQAVEKFLDAGAKRISAHQLMLLHGAELSNPDSRSRFGFDTRFRVVARNVGDYTGEPVVEVEEMVVATPTFTWDDYLETRVFHLLLTIFYYEGNFEEAFEVARSFGIKAYDLAARLPQLRDRAPAALQTVIDDFLREGREELFMTREACAEWATAHFAGLIDGSLGGNLLSKYSMVGRFYATMAAIDFLGTGIRTILAERGEPQRDDEIRAVEEFLRASMVHVPFFETLEHEASILMPYDIEAWHDDGYAHDLTRYRLDPPRRVTLLVPPETKGLIRTKLETFGEHPSGLGKFTRTMFARDLRRVAQHEGATAR